MKRDQKKNKNPRQWSVEQLKDITRVVQDLGFLFSPINTFSNASRCLCITSYITVHVS